MTRLLMGNLILALIFAAVSGSFSGLSLLFGFVLGALSLALIREQIGAQAYLTRMRRVVVLAGTFVYELVMSSIRVARTVLSPEIRIRPGIIAYPLTAKSDAEITLLANLVTLTPGTLSVDVSADRSILYIHCIDVDDADSACADIKRSFERQILEAFE